MAIPDFQSTMLPLLKYLSDGNEHSNQEIYEALENQFDMTDEEKKELLPSGKQRIFVNRVAWAKSYLKQAGFVESLQRGYYKITDLGKSVVLDEKLQRIDTNYLMKFQTFVAFRQGRNNNEQNTSQVDRHTDGCSSEKTPEEYIEFGFNSIEQKLRQELKTSIRGLSSRFFEKLVIDLLLSMGYGGSRQEAGKLTNKGSDEGIDGIINEDKLGLDVIYVQAKRWENNISRPEIQKFAGALQGKRAKKGIYITTSTFTKEAQEFVRSIESKIVLIDGERLAELMIEYNVGVAVVQAFQVKKVDTDYFFEE
ncbi:MAG: restriction endonuclease [Solidesulfovibrio sp.]